MPVEVCVPLYRANAPWELKTLLRGPDYPTPKPKLPTGRAAREAEDAARKAALDEREASLHELAAKLEKRAMELEEWEKELQQRERSARSYPGGIFNSAPSKSPRSKPSRSGR